LIIVDIIGVNDISDSDKENSWIRRMAKISRLANTRLGRVYALRKMDEMTNFEIKIGLLRESESRFGTFEETDF